jgi:dehydrogenase/reductase SDR family member 7B
MKGKLVLITGASSGIGRACAVELGRRGASLIVTGRNKERLDALRRSLTSSKVHCIQADLEVPAEVTRLCREAIAVEGRIDIVINCAGLILFGLASEGDRLLLQRLFSVNVLAPVQIVSEVLPMMPSGSVIVNVASIAADFVHPRAVHYSASKAALKSYSEGLWMEARGLGIRVVCACPGYVMTPMHDHRLAGDVPTSVRNQKHLHITAERCARSIVRAIDGGSDFPVIPPMGWGLILLTRLFPRLVYSWVERLLRRSGANSRTTRA